MSHDIPHGPEQDRLDRAVGALRAAAVPDGPPEAVFANTLKALREAENSKRSQTLFSRMTTMKSLSRIAAAVLLAGGLAVLVLLRSPSVSFGQVLNKVSDAKTMTFSATTTLPQAGGGGDGPRPAVVVAKPLVVRFSMTSDGRTRIDGAGGSATVIDQRSGKMLQLDPALKRATVTEGMSYGLATNPIESFRKLAGTGAKPIGEKEAGGRKLKGFAVGEKNQEFTVWADASSAEPVTIETTVPMMGGRGTIVMGDFVFEPKLDDALFSLEPPAGYEVKKLDAKFVETATKGAGEDHVIAALRGYAEKRGGKFPAKLDDWGAYATLVTGSKANPGELQPTEMQLMAHVGALTPFLMSLPKDGWAYLGDGVTLGEKEKVVFWYRDSGKETYRAVYGDLSVREVRGEDLPGK